MGKPGELQLYRLWVCVLSVSVVGVILELDAAESGVLLQLPQLSGSPVLRSPRGECMPRAGGLGFCCAAENTPRSADRKFCGLS